MLSNPHVLQPSCFPTLMLCNPHVFQPSCFLTLYVLQLFSSPQTYFDLIQAYILQATLPIVFSSRKFAEVFSSSAVPYFSKSELPAAAPQPSHIGRKIKKTLHQKDPVLLHRLLWSRNVSIGSVQSHSHRPFWKHQHHSDSSSVFPLWFSASRFSNVHNVWMTRTLQMLWAGHTLKDHNFQAQNPYMNTSFPKMLRNPYA